MKWIQIEKVLLPVIRLRAIWLDEDVGGKAGDCQIRFESVDGSTVTTAIMPLDEAKQQHLEILNRLNRDDLLNRAND
jgi:hypothetical protein